MFAGEDGRTDGVVRVELELVNHLLRSGVIVLEVIAETGMEIDDRVRQAELVKHGDQVVRLEERAVSGITIELGPAVWVVLLKEPVVGGHRKGVRGDEKVFVSGMVALQFPLQGMQPE